jgi:YesN/AraC family two-component response regulator
MQIILEKLSPHENSLYLFREYIQPCFTSPRHYHQEYELTYIEESYGKLYIGNSIVDFRKGDLFLFSPMLIHCFKNQKGYELSEKRARAICIFFKPDFLGSEFLDKSQAKVMNSLFQKTVFGLKFKEPKKEIVSLLKSIKTSKNLQGIIKLLNILDDLSLQKDFTVLSDTMLNKYYYKHSKDNRIEKVVDYVFKNYSTRITAMEISNLVNMSTAGFSRFFKSRTEIIFTLFINEIRIAQAQKLLTESNKSIHDISRECGYKNLSYFNRQFKLHNNLSPKTFREYFENTSVEGK